MFSGNASIAQWRSSLAKLELRLTCCRNQEGELSSCSEESWAVCSSIDEFGNQID